MNWHTSCFLASHSESASVSLTYLNPSSPLGHARAKSLTTTVYSWALNWVSSKSQPISCSWMYVSCIWSWLHFLLLLFMSYTLLLCVLIREDFQSKESVRNFNWNSTWLWSFTSFTLDLTFTVAAYDCLNPGQLSESGFSSTFKSSTKTHNLVIS